MVIEKLLLFLVFWANYAYIRVEMFISLLWMEPMPKVSMYIDMIWAIHVTTLPVDYAVLPSGLFGMLVRLDCVIIYHIKAPICDIFDYINIGYIQSWEVWPLDGNYAFWNFFLNPS